MTRHLNCVIAFTLKLGFSSDYEYYIGVSLNFDSQRRRCAARIDCVSSFSPRCLLIRAVFTATGELLRFPNPDIEEPPVEQTPREAMLLLKDDAPSLVTLLRFCRFMQF